MKFKVEKFSGKIDFNLWKKRVKAALVQQNLHKALLDNEKLGITDADEWSELALKASSTIELCLADEVINNVEDCKTIHIEDCKTISDL